MNLITTEKNKRNHGLTALVTIALACCLLVCALSACSPRESSDLAIGVQSDDSASFTITNQTGHTITGFALKASTQTDYTSNMMPADTTFANEQTAVVYFAEVESASVAGDKALNTVYDLQLTCDDGTIIDMHDLNLADLTEVTLHYEDGVGFITFTDADGKTISTKDNAIAWRAQAEAAAAAAEAEAAAAAEAEEASYYYEDSYGSASSSDYGYDTSAGQSSNGCLDL